MVASGKNQVTDAFWKVGITDPLNNSTNNFINRIELRNKALASSGNYRKFLIDKESGKKIVHTINPKTGDAFETNVLGASVIADDCITADAYATSFMAMPIKKSKEVISNFENIDVTINVTAYKNFTVVRYTTRLYRVIVFGFKFSKNTSMHN